MRNLPKPHLCEQEVFDACNSKLRDKNLKARLTAFYADVAADALSYNYHGLTEQFHLFPARNLAASNVTAKELVTVYKRMSSAKEPGRKYYDILKSSAPHDECPFCAHGVVKTLDHFLPKQSFPVLSVLPLNLVPSCRDCNTEKLTLVPSSSDEEIFHPYYDNIDGDNWLKATVLQIAPVALTFSVDAPAHWSNPKKARIENHFDKLKLGMLYSTQAARLLTGIKSQVQSLYGAGGTVAVRKHLEESATTWSVPNMNSWQAASYRALAGSVWYCTGGFH